MTPNELFQAGRLDEAVTAAVEAVKKNPTDTAVRGFFCELLCTAGDFERADKQLDVLSQQDPRAQVGISMFRQLIRAETARQQFFSEGRVPEVLEEPSPVLQLHLEASVHLRDGQKDKAVELLSRAAEQRARVSGVCDGEKFDDFRDMDDLIAPLMEVLTSTGKYFWIPIERVESIEFHKPERPRDLIWRRAHMVVTGGPDGEVFLPTIYAGTHATGDAQLRLGRGTDWSDGQPVQGHGLRMFLLGDQDKTILQLETIEFDKE